VAPASSDVAQDVKGADPALHKLTLRLPSRVGCIDRRKFGRSLRRSFLEIRDQNLDKLRRRLGSAAAGGGNTMSAGNIRTICDGRGGMYVDEFVGEEHVATGWDIDFELTKA